MWTAWPFLVWLLVARTVAAGSQVFATCTALVSVNSLAGSISLTDLTAVNTLLTTLGGVVKTLGGTTLPTGPQCETLCRAAETGHPDGYRYSIHAQGLNLLAAGGIINLGLSDLTGTCICSDKEPPANMAAPGSNPSGDCADLGGTIDDLLEPAFDALAASNLVLALAGAVVKGTILTALGLLPLNSPVGVVGARVTYLRPYKATFTSCVGSISGGTSMGNVASFDACGTLCQTAKGLGTTFTVRPGYQSKAATCTGIGLDTLGNLGLPGNLLNLDLVLPVPLSVPELLATGNTNYECVCAPTLGSSMNCNKAIYDLTSCKDKLVGASLAVPATYAYNVYTLPATASGVWRREQMAFRTAKPVTMCPRGLTACNVGRGQTQDFECIDPEWELESCGGCIHGNFGVNGTIPAPGGIDCTKLNAAPGAVSCERGECRIRRCRRGYVLKAGECVRVRY